MDGSFTPDVKHANEGEDCPALLPIYIIISASINDELLYKSQPVEAHVSPYSYKQH